MLYYFAELSVDTKTGEKNSEYMHAGETSMDSQELKMSINFANHSSFEIRASRSISIVLCVFVIVYFINGPKWIPEYEETYSVKCGNFT